MILFRVVVSAIACLSFILFPADLSRAFSFYGSAGDVVIDRTRRDDPGFKALSGALAHYLMGSIYDNFGRTAPAISEYSKALVHRDDVAAVYARLGADFLLLGKLEDARAQLKKAMELAPQQIKPCLLLAVVYTAEGEYQKAQAQYEKVLEKDPENIRVLAFLSDLFIVQENLGKAAEIYERMLRISPNDAFLYFNLGVIYSKTDQLVKAEESLKKAIEIDKGYTEAQMVLGVVYEIEGELREAAKQYEVVTKIDPSDPYAHARLGHVYFRLGRVDEAIGQIRVLMSLDPRSPDPYLKIFSIYIIRNRYDDARAVLNEALANGISEAVIHASLGYLAILEQKYEQAVGHYTVAAEKDPGNGLYGFYLAAALERAGKEEEAMRLLEECVSDGTEFAEVYNYLGYMYADAGRDLDRAIVLIRKALELDPGNGAYIDSLGWAFYRKGMLEEALGYMKEAAGLLPDDPVVREHLGDVYFSMGAVEKARQAWKKALELDPVSLRIKEKLKTTGLPQTVP